MKKTIDLSSLNIENLVGKIKNIKKVFWFLGAHIFIFILIFILLDMLFGIFLLYEYAIWPQQREPEVMANTLKFQDKAYQEVLRELQSREEKFGSVLEGNYLNPFRSKTSTSGQPKLQ